MRADNKTGFTLIEMMIVVAIMSILSVIAAPNFTHYMAQRRLNGAARMVMSDLMLARQKAVSINQGVKVSFAVLNNHAYEIWNDADKNGTVADNEGDDLVKDIHSDYYDVTFSASAAPIFNPRGTASVAIVTLASSRSGVSSKTVTVDLNGRVRID